MTVPHRKKRRICLYGVNGWYSESITFRPDANLFVMGAKVFYFALIIIGGDWAMFIANDIEDDISDILIN